MPPIPARNPRFRALARLVGEAIGTYRMVEEGDRILVGFSGGKDSTSLMHLLAHLQRRAPVRFTLVAATFDPGFPGLKMAEIAEYCRRQGWEHRTIACPVHELVQQRSLQGSPCSFCSRLRRGYLYRLSEEIGATKLALGQHLDDACASLLMSLFRGGGLKTMGPNVLGNQGRIRLIRPLCLVEEAELAQLARELEYPDFGRCEYETALDAEGDRAFLENLVAQLEGRFANIRQHMLHSLRDVRPLHLYDPRHLAAAAGGELPDNIETGQETEDAAAVLSSSGGGFAAEKQYGLP